MQSSEGVGAGILDNGIGRYVGSDALATLAIVCQHYISPIEVNPDAEGILEALENLAAEASK